MGNTVNGPPKRPKPSRVEVPRKVPPSELEYFFTVVTLNECHLERSRKVFPSDAYWAKSKYPEGVFPIISNNSSIEEQTHQNENIENNLILVLFASKKDKKRLRYLVVFPLRITS